MDCGNCEARRDIFPIESGSSGQVPARCWSNMAKVRCPLTDQLSRLRSAGISAFAAVWDVSVCAVVIIFCSPNVSVITQVTENAFAHRPALKLFAALSQFDALLGLELIAN